MTVLFPGRLARGYPHNPGRDGVVVDMEYTYIRRLTPSGNPARARLIAELRTHTPLGQVTERWYVTRSGEIYLVTSTGFQCWYKGELPMKLKVNMTRDELQRYHLVKQYW